MPFEAMSFEKISSAALTPVRPSKAGPKGARRCLPPSSPSASPAAGASDPTLRLGLCIACFARYTDHSNADSEYVTVPARGEGERSKGLTRPISVADRIP